MKQSSKDARVIGSQALGMPISKRNLIIHRDNKDNLRIQWAESKSQTLLV